MRLFASLKSLFALLVCLCFLFVASAQAQVDQLPRAGRNPVIIVVGIGGIVLVNPQTGEVMWPRLFGGSIKRPLCVDKLNCKTDGLKPERPFRIEKVAWFLPKIAIYDSLIVELERAGYWKGDFAHPAPDGDRDTYYVLLYDWRVDVVEAAQLLAQQIAELKERLDRPNLRFDIIAHSTGGLIARYFAMYGGRDVLTSPQPVPDWAGAAHLDQMILLGTPNDGSMEAFRALLQGYSNSSAARTRWAELDRLFLGKLSKEVLFTILIFYQLLPHQADELFKDETLSPVKVDLYNIEAWRRFKWGAAFDEKFRERERREKGAQESDRLQLEREDFLRQMLTRAAALHRALDATATPPPQTTIHFLGSACRKTLAGALILRASGNNSASPKTVFRASQLNGDADGWLFKPGDGRVTTASARLPHCCGNLPSKKPCGVCYSHIDLVSNSAVTSYLPIILQQGRRADLLALQQGEGHVHEMPVIDGCRVTHPCCH